MEYILLSLSGLILGSFVNALVWRLREMSGESDGNDVGKDQKSKKVSKSSSSKGQSLDLSIWRGRSMCPQCRHQLGVFDLIPVLSWVLLGGKCRYCRKPISWQYPVVELALAGLFIISYIWWPFGFDVVYQFILFALWCVILTVLMALAVYDLRWMILPNKLLYPLAGFSLIFLGVQSLHEGFSATLSGVLGGLLIGGFFYLIYLLSKGEWIGGGDVRYGFLMGLLLGWQKMLIGLMAAAYTGTLLVIILILIRKYHKKMRVPFGPFLIFGTVLAMLRGQEIIDWYLRLSGF